MRFWGPHGENLKPGGIPSRIGNDECLKIRTEFDPIRFCLHGAMLGHAALRFSDSFRIAKFFHCRIRWLHSHIGLRIRCSFWSSLVRTLGKRAA